MTDRTYAKGKIAMVIILPWVVSYFEKNGMPIKKRSTPDSQLLNVDLDVYSRSDLQFLVKSFGKKVIVLYVGRERRGYSAHLELAGIQNHSADAAIRAFCALVRSLPKTERGLWNGARTREFSVGVQAGQRPFACDFRIEAQTVKTVAELGAVIVLTVYGSEMAKRKNALK
jgi:hypothetical protein